MGVRPAERLRPAGFARLEDFAQLDSPSWKVSPGWSCPVGGFHPAEGLFFQGTRGPWASNATFVQAAGKHLVRTSQDPRHAGGFLLYGLRDAENARVASYHFDVRFSTI